MKSIYIILSLFFYTSFVFCQTNFGLQTFAGISYPFPVTKTRLAPTLNEDIIPIGFTASIHVDYKLKNNFSSYLTIFYNFIKPINYSLGGFKTFEDWNYGTESTYYSKNDFSFLGVGVGAAYLFTEKFLSSTGLNLIYHPGYNESYWIYGYNGSRQDIENGTERINYTIIVNVDYLFSRNFKVFMKGEYFFNKYQVNFANFPLIQVYFGVGYCF